MSARRLCWFLVTTTPVKRNCPSPLTSRLSLSWGTGVGCGMTTRPMITRRSPRLNALTTLVATHSNQDEEGNAVNPMNEKKRSKPLIKKPRVTKHHSEETRGLPPQETSTNDDDDETANGIDCLPRTRQHQLEQAQPGLYVFGIDEAGRGPLAGPVVAAAAYVPTNVTGINDSKQVAQEADRQLRYEALLASPGVEWAVAVVDAQTIDRINILQATFLAMTLATNGLLQVYHGQTSSEEDSDNDVPLVLRASAEVEHLGCYVVTGKPPPLGNIGKNQKKHFALVDGNRVPPRLPCPAESLIKGDGREYSIAAASILAKVTRDTLMHGYHELYPAYQLNQHKGYPTAAHRAAVTVHGASAIHRRTFAPLKHMSFHPDGKVLSLTKDGQKSDEKFKKKAGPPAKAKTKGKIACGDVDEKPTKKAASPKPKQKRKAVTNDDDDKKPTKAATKVKQKKKET